MKKYNKKTILQIAIETNNFITKTRYQRFYNDVARYYKDITGWYLHCDIHHIDGNPCNNHPSNLKCISSSEHRLLHKK